MAARSVGANAGLKRLIFGHGFAIAHTKLDLAAVMEQTGAQDASLLGFSLGGGEVARYMSCRHGNQVKHAVLVSSVFSM